MRFRLVSEKIQLMVEVIVFKNTILAQCCGSVLKLLDWMRFSFLKTVCFSKKNVGLLSAIFQAHVGCN